MARRICHGKRNPNCTAKWHGTQSAYNNGNCRCPHACEANRLYHKRRREQRQPDGYTDATIARRMLQALNAMGWPFNDLANQLHTEQSHLRRIARGDERAQKIFRSSAARIDTVYRNLSGVPGPSDISRQRAATKGWLSPIHWDNIRDLNEQPKPPLATAGEPLTQRRERHEARYQQFAALAAAGHTARHIRAQLGGINHTLYQKLRDRHQAETTTSEVAA